MVRRARTEDFALPGYLATLTHDELIALVSEAATTSDAFAARLHGAMAKSTGDTRALKEQIKLLLPARRFLDWRASNAYARDADAVYPMLAELVEGGRATEAIPLIEYAFERLNTLLRRADDSSGMIGGIASALLDLHLRACTAGKPDPRKLARWLITVGVDDSHQYFSPNVDEYAEALGPDGLADYRGVVDEQWAAGGRGFGVRHAKERLARLDKDIATLTEVVGVNAFNDGVRLGLLAETLFEIGLNDEGLAHAERAIEAGASMHLVTPYDLAAAEHLRRGEPDEALRLLREALVRSPTVGRYITLRGVADDLGVWSTERIDARQILRGQDVGALVLAMLADGDAEEAWQTAQGQQLYASVWDELAAVRVDTHPADVVPILQDRILELLVKADTRVYKKATKQIVALGQVCERAGLDATFEEFVAMLRAEFGRRPTFIEALNRAL